MAGLKKEEIIRSKKELELLFEKNASSVVMHREGGVKILCRIKPRLLATEEKSAIKDGSKEANSKEGLKIEVLFSVGKKTEPKATRRNRIKRLMREVFRLNKEKIYTRCTALGIKDILQMAFIFSGRAQKKTDKKNKETKSQKPKLPTYHEFEAWMSKGSEKIIGKAEPKKQN